MFRKSMLLVLCMFVAIGAVADEDDWMKKARNSKVPAGIESPDASVREAKVGGSKMTGDPLGAPAVVNVYDLFKTGEFSYALNSLAYLAAISSAAKERIQEHRAVLVKNNASANVLTLFDAYITFALSFPHGTGYGQWTQADKDRWNSNLWSDYWTALTKEYFEKPGEVFLWAGHDMLRLGWAVPLDVDNGFEVSKLLPSVKSALQNIAWMVSAPEFQSLTPDVQAALKKIESYNARSKDPLADAMGKQDIYAIRDEALKVRQAARDGKLLK